MSWDSEHGGGLRRVRLSEWARAQGIARITAYRMLQRGILPAPSERSPTGRWYVLVPVRTTGRIAFYIRAAPGARQAQTINEQLTALSEWAASHRQQPSIVVKEIADPFVARMPKLAQLLADRQISDIVVKNPSVIGESKYGLLIAALALQGRAIVLVDRRSARLRVDSGDARAALQSLCNSMHGPEKGRQALHLALDPGGGV